MIAHGEIWPALPYKEFRSTAHLLHMGVQVIGKLKLHSPFEPHWANVPLFLTAQGLSTGPIAYKTNVFSIDLNFIEHQIIGVCSSGLRYQFSLRSMSVAEFTQQLFLLLKALEIDLSINLMPQEISNPIAFDQDKEVRIYDSALANAWWRILINSYNVMQIYHARFDGETPPVALMWGTFDLRDVRFNGEAVATTGINAGYIRRNAMDEAQIEIGWWPGNEMYPQPAYYAFTYPKPANIENAVVLPQGARWDAKLEEFILDYDILRQSKNPKKDLLDFFESTYQAGARCANWKSSLIKTGKPI